MIMDGMEEYIGISMEQAKEDQKAMDLVKETAVVDTSKAEAAEETAE